jgi:hypothetical protein
MPPIVASETEVEAWRMALFIHQRSPYNPRRCICQKRWPCPRRAELRGWLIACGAGIEEQT